MDTMITDQVIIYLTNRLRDDRERIVATSYGRLGFVEEFTSSKEMREYAWEMTAAIVMQYLNIEFRPNDYEIDMDLKRGTIDMYKHPRPYNPKGGNETNFNKMKHIMRLRFFFVPHVTEHQAMLKALQDDLCDKVQKI